MANTCEYPSIIITEVFQCSVSALLQIARPMWAFFVASGLTFFLVTKAQNAGVKCTLFVTYHAVELPN